MRKMLLVKTSTAAVADIVRAELARRRIPQSALALALGWSSAAVSRRLSGLTPLDVDELGAIAEFLDMDCRDLLPAPARGEVPA